MFYALAILQLSLQTIVDVCRADSSDPYVSVILYLKLRELPPFGMAVCSEDTLSNDGMLFRDALDTAGQENSPES
ncbi:hypothetical protein HYALB_00012090 [Hymenoscyphus albidus]|uniref:Secreted protein n=1 Tax=Hymenoscyphus albidus TaxID=595503 RepID=A0A9N9LL60_9HELO|nr:hypothetical protein HYALB_00012090 [Hymenoscyphus albidus]